MLIGFIKLKEKFYIRNSKPPNDNQEELVRPAILYRGSGYPAWKKRVTLEKTGNTNAQYFYQKEGEKNNVLHLRLIDMVNQVTSNFQNNYESATFFKLSLQ